MLLTLSKFMLTGKIDILLFLHCKRPDRCMSHKN